MKVKRCISTRGEGCCQCSITWHYSSINTYQDTVIFETGHELAEHCENQRTGALSTAIKDLTCNFELIDFHPLNALKSMNYQLSNGFGPSYAQNLGEFDNFEKKLGQTCLFIHLCKFNLLWFKPNQKSY